ncbi:MAG: CBS domain-containing protein [Gammaproteobacteria bacterium]|nr:CBS domain-containing protein [Gammaproteobacteria bacterium]
MPCNYQELEIKTLQVAATLCDPSQTIKGKVELEDPAIDIMTDLSEILAITISPSRTLSEATDRMLKMKVKLLFVTDSKDRIIGLITYSDIQGERPIQFQQTNGVPRSEVCVLDIMTGIESIEALDWNIVKTARVGDIAMTMKKLNRQHALVLEHPTEDTYQIRGIFSISLLSKLLGFHMDTTEVAKTFAEFERVLGCSN